MTDYNDKYNLYKGLVDDAVQSNVRFDSLVGEAMMYSVSGGKRIRGILVCAFSDFLGGTDSNTALAAAAIECLHAYSLIHDDLPCMDNDDYRRGLPSCHKKYGEYIALLAGDGLLTHAFSLLSRMSDAAVVQRAVSALSECGGASGMILGQEIDLCPTRPKTIAELDNLHYHKTGKLFECTAMLACACKNSNKDTEEALKSFMRELGLVFQIIDDVLDVTSSVEILGKPIKSDGKNQKVTYLSFMSVDECKNLAYNKTKLAVERLISSVGCSDFIQELAYSLAARIR